MELIDLISIFGLIIGLILAVIMYMLIKQKKVKAKALPRILGIGGWVYAFMFGMTTSILLRPISEFAMYTIENLFWSLAVGVVAFFSGRKIAHLSPD